MPAFEPRLLLPWAAVLVLPPLGPLLESRMTPHMLVQIPALVLIGLLLSRRWLRSRPAVRQFASDYRWPLLLLALGTLMVWMIPRLLDLAVESAAVDAAKLVSLLFLGGVPLGLAWSALGPVVRAILHVEALASLWRLGWLYLESPTRLCTRYALDDQTRLGGILLMLGAGYATWLLLCALWPRPLLHGSPPLAH